MSAKKQKTGEPYVWLRRTPQGFVPYSQLDADLIERYVTDHVVTCTLFEPRDQAMNRRFHAVVGTVAKALGRNLKAFRGELIMEAGFFGSATVHPGGSVQAQPMDIKDMCDSEFRDLFWRVFEILQTKYMPDIDSEEIIDQINSYAGLDR